MKVKKLVSFEQEVDVDIYIDDILSSLGTLADEMKEPEGASFATTSLLNSCVGFIMKVPSDLIARLPEKTRKRIAEVMSAEALRYQMPAAESAGDSTDG